MHVFGAPIEGADAWEFLVRPQVSSLVLSVSSDIETPRLRRQCDRSRRSAPRCLRCRRQHPFPLNYGGSAYSDNGAEHWEIFEWINERVRRRSSRRRSLGIFFSPPPPDLLSSTLCFNQIQNSQTSAPMKVEPMFFSSAPQRPVPTPFRS